MGRLIRLPDWQSRLHVWLKSIHGTPIEPGRHDCCLFVAGAIEAQTGVDIAAPWRGRYTTMAGGRRVLRRAGYADHVALAAATLPEIHASAAREGDIAMVETPDGPAMGVVQGSAIYVLSMDGRLTFAPLTPATCIFKVG